MRHFAELLRAHDEHVEELLEIQLTDEGDPRRGGFWRDSFHIETREVGFRMSELIFGYLLPESRWHGSERVERAVRMALDYLAAHQRPDGCFDLSPCNFASPPDTAFMINSVLEAWWLLEKSDEGAWLREPLYRLIDSACTGIAAGGFHTPNHRWAISSCLLSWYKVSGREELRARAEEYLREGLDINADGEFAERSAGNYNQVNDDQMLRLHRATGEERFLRAAEANLDMMMCYFDPDGSVFTNNSTRQDMGRKLYADTYYIFYLSVGQSLGRKDFGAMAEWIYRDCRCRGTLPPGFQWLALHPEMDGYGADEPFAKPFEDYSRHFPDSRIARVRHGDFSYTLLDGKPNFLYFQHGSFSVYLTIYSNLCDRRNFLSDSLERTETGWRMRSHAAGWYYLPFPEKPETSDWWAMDNPHRRPKTEGLPLDTTIDIAELPDGIELHLRTEGIDQLPLRLEMSFLPGGTARTEHFIQAAAAGVSVNVLDGELEVTGPSGEGITVGPAFGAHNVTDRMGGAYPLSAQHYTAYLTAYTPVDQTLALRARRKARHV